MEFCFFLHSCQWQFLYSAKKPKKTKNKNKKNQTQQQYPTVLEIHLIKQQPVVVA
jgi:hypothetical protein